MFGDLVTPKYKEVIPDNVHNSARVHTANSTSKIHFAPTPLQNCTYTSTYTSPTQSSNLSSSGLFATPPNTLENTSSKTSFAVLKKPDTGSDFCGTLRVNGVECKYLLDTGSDITLITEQLYNTIRQHQQIELQPINSTFMSVNGIIPVMGRFEATIQIGHQFIRGEVIVSPMLSDKMILGRDMLMKCDSFATTMNEITASIKNLDWSLCTDLSLETPKINDHTESPVVVDINDMNEAIIEE